MKDVGSGSQCVKKDGVKRVTMMPVIKVDVMYVEIRVYGVVCVVVVKKIERSRVVIEKGTIGGRKRILSCQEQQTSPECNLLAFDSR